MFPGWSVMVYPIHGRTPRVRMLRAENLKLAPDNATLRPGLCASANAENDGHM